MFHWLVQNYPIRAKFAFFYWLFDSDRCTFAHFQNSAMKKIMRKNIGLALVAMATLLFGCQNDAGNSEKGVESIQTEGKISSIIRSPITADGAEDSLNVAKMEFEEPIFEFGEVDEGAVIKHEFKFMNTGKVPLVIQNAHSTCGCTIPKWPTDMIAPGKGGVINVEFNTKGKSEFQEKPVIITANTYPSITQVYLKGTVHKLDK